MTAVTNARVTTAGGIIALAALLSLIILPGCTVGPKAGDKAPAFVAEIETGDTVPLASLMGEKGLVMYFYPKDETPGCITQACTFQDRLVEFQDEGFNVVGVSVDTGGSHQTFRTKHAITFHLIADTDKSIAKLYNVPVEEDPFGTVGYRRTTFVIARDGTILDRFEQTDPAAQVAAAADRIHEPF